MWEWFKKKDEIDLTLKVDEKLEAQVNIAMYKFFIRHKLDIRRDVLEDIKRDIDTGQIEKRVGASLHNMLDVLRNDIISKFKSIEDCVDHNNSLIDKFDNRLDHQLRKVLNEQRNLHANKIKSLKAKHKKSLESK